MKYFFKKQLKRLSHYGVCVALGVSCTFCVPIVSYATSTQEKLDETNDRIEDLKAAQDILGDDLSALNSQLSAATDNLTTLNEQISKAGEDIAALEESIKEASGIEKEQYEMMKLRIRYMYENSSAESALSLLFSSGDMREFLTRAEYITKVTMYDRDMLKRYQETHNALVASQEQLQQNKTDLEALSTKAQKEQDEIKSLVQDTQDKIDMSADELAEAERKALEYEKQIEAEEIARQEAARKAAEEAARKAAEEAARNSSGSSGAIPDGMSLLHMQTINKLISYTPQELNMLAAIIYCESGNQSYEGKLAVGSVVLNRINNPRWPNTMVEVLYQPNQFTPVKSGRFALALSNGVPNSCVQAALEVLSKGSTIDSLYFHAVQPGEAGGTIIGDHIFF